MKKVILIFLTIFQITAGYSQTTFYVNPDATSTSADGSLANPYKDIAATVHLLKSNGGGDVIVIDGEYDMTGREVVITTSVSKAKAITIKPKSTAGVKFNFNGRFGFEFATGSKNITLEGFELDGETDELDYWDIVARGFWGNDDVERNGGLAVILDGENITLKDNYIHHWYQKAVEIRDARYAVIQGNIIHDIATTSLSGGHGIMRQQKGQEFFDDDQGGVYRWDIIENMIFNVEQTIYSWVPSKGFIEMVIDEGKSILIDDPKDSDGNQEHMSARIKNNIVAFGSVDHIRLKSTPNLEVSHNSIYSNKSNGDGITDKQGDKNTPQFTNFICLNNASYTVTGISAIEIDKCVEQTIDNGGTPNVAGNYAMDGNVKPPGQSGINSLSGDQLFVAPELGDFKINPALGLPSSTGVESAVLDAIDQKLSDFNTPINPSIIEVDHLKLSQTILDNIPGLNDGIAGNENVFEDYGSLSENYHTITFNVVNDVWKNETGSPGKQKFELNENYYMWYENIATTYLNANNNEYERIRWGNSEVKQNQMFDPDWLTVCQITGSGSNTLINGYDNNFVLDGDLLIDFENYTPVVGEHFDLMSAKTIEGNKIESLFSRILFKGHTPNEYSLDIVDEENGQVLRLSIGDAVGVKNTQSPTTTFSITPNPFRNSLQIEAAPSSIIQVYKLNGQKIDFKRVINSKGISISTQNWKRGAYLIEVDGEVKKVVKQ